VTHLLRALALAVSVAATLSPSSAFAAPPPTTPAVAPPLDPAPAAPIVAPLPPPPYPVLPPGYGVPAYGAPLGAYAPPQPVMKRNVPVMVAGIGVLVLAAGLFAGAVVEVMDGICITLGSGPSCPDTSPAVIGLSIGGVVALAVGIPMVVLGAKRVPMNADPPVMLEPKGLPAWAGAPAGRGWAWRF
jgi:hypothetical protein